ncbi:MAG TPA: pectinesterase family protein [Ferruginibacter sp.]|nr:pectinesterase family protein [Ferruginibacter sp.]HMP20566.1 pectinesterase family protein [Ferruginibacter sp.]
MMKLICTTLLAIALCAAQATFAYDLTVAKDGSGNFTTIQEAVNAAPTGLTAPYTIFIKNGIYKEKITVPSNKPFLKFVGETVANVIITYDDYAAKNTSCNATLGTQNSATVTINATDFSAVNITFENSYGDGSQAVAIVVNNDRAAFKNCRFLGNQDTLYLKGGGPPKAYFTHCYIDGNVDFIFGNSIALFDSCVVYAKTRTSAGVSYITAPNTPAGQTYGFVFRNARLPYNTGNTLYYLSRPWPSPSEAGTAQHTVFINTLMSQHIHPDGWAVWNANTITANLRYSEYQSKFFSGAPVDVSKRVAWSSQLTQQEAEAYTPAAMFGSWDPCALLDGNCSNVPADIAVSNFRVSTGAVSSLFRWNISWPLPGIKYQLFRSADKSNFTEIYTETAVSDTAINFQYTDFSLPAPGTSYYYYVVASKNGYASHITDTIRVSAEASLQVNAPAALTLCGFTQVLGTPSVSQTYTISGANLTGNISITPSTDFEVSANNIDWYNSATPLVLTPVGGTQSTLTIYVRLNAGAVDTYTGSIANETNGVAIIYVPVSGKTVPPSSSDLLQQWPLTANAADNAAVRSAAVTASTATLHNLFTTDGSLPAPPGTIPAYSVQYGQAFGANAAGNNWQSVGGTLRRTHYQQFTVTASPGNSVRLDSITLFSNFYATNSNTKMAVVYSKNGFGSPADSAEISDGVGPSGSALSFAASGNFTKSFTLAQNNSGPADYYALALKGNTGVQLNEGETLTIRLYWACGSTGTPRFALLKNVAVKGVVTTPTPLKLLAFNATYSNNKVMLNWRTSNEENTREFDVERSLDGVRFITMGHVSARNTAGQNNYSFTDNDDFSGIAFYRLKMKDRDGGFAYSFTTSVNIRRGDSLKVLPNMVSSNMYVFHSKAKEGAKIEVYAFDGRQVLKLNVQRDAVQTPVNAAMLPAGNYNLVYINGIKTEFVKFVKQ